MTGTITHAAEVENEQNEDLPDLEFLEFLGQFETDAGEWIDPDSLLTDEFTELLEASAAANPDIDSSSTDEAADNDQ